jgi:16S rRNA (guanine527-N7)-methyltransferase
VKHFDGLGETVSRETFERLYVYRDLLLRWNARINLVSAGSVETLWGRHFLDSLQLLPLLPPGTPRAIDLGSGAGFPGLVLSIASGVEFDLVESDQRKAAFLREVGRETGAQVRVHAVRIEAAEVAPAPLITARALAPLADLLRLTCPLLTPRGVALFPKGAKVEQELTDAAAAWNMRVERFPSQTDPAGVILRLSEVTSV